MNREEVTAETVKRAELDFILNRKPDDSNKDPPLWGLALSGGGIRSATFALGVLQVLARNKLLGSFHYLSTISGGGYAGAFLQGLIRRRGFEGAYGVLRSSVQDVAQGTAASRERNAATDAQQPIRHLREYSNYLSPRKTTVSGDTLAMLGTYCRNLLLIQTQIFALVLTLSFVPSLVFPWMLRGAARWPFGLFAAAVMTGFSAAAVFVWVLTPTNGAARRASGSPAAATTASRSTVKPMGDPPSQSVVRGVLISILLLFLAVLLGATALWGLNTLIYPPESDASADAELLRAKIDWTIFGMTAGAYLVLWMIWLVFSAMRFRRSADGDRDDSGRALVLNGARFCLATLGASMFAGLALVTARHIFFHWIGFIGIWHALVLGPTCVLLAITLTGIFHIGLAGPALTDLQREIWARVGARLFAFVALGAGLFMAITVYGPLLLRYGLWFAQSTWWAATGWVGVAGWMLTTGAGLLTAYSQRSSGEAKNNSSLGFELIAKAAPWVFLLGLAILVSFAGQEILGAVGRDPQPSLEDVKVGDIATTYLANLSRGGVRHYRTLLATAAAAFAVWLALGYAVDLNEFSLNAFYRNRLVRCYLGASNSDRDPEPTTNFDPKDDLVLADVVQEKRDGDDMRPLFPLVGTALNLIDTKQLDWQDRKAASFCLTPGYCGYIPPPSHSDASPVGDAESATAGTAIPRVAGDGKPPPNPIAASLTLGDAMAISGAAVSPNMGYHSSPAVTLLLALFDARLGWWLPNPNLRRNDAADVPRFSGWWLISEMLGLTNEYGRLIYLSDGGHFENLGIYELVRRRCQFILCVDASADPKRDFADLGDAIQKCRIDFGVEIQIDTSDLLVGEKGLSQACYTTGDIKYPTGEVGKLLYLKPSLVGKEPTDVSHYASAHSTFPHESTADQYFDESQFESYRRLGESVAVGALEAVIDRVCGPRFREDDAQSLSLGDSPLKTSIFDALVSGSDRADSPRST